MTSPTPMLKSRLLRFSRNPWANGLRLALLNGALAAFCAVSFLGVLGAVSWLNRLIHAHGSRSPEMPFPYPLLLLAYVVVLLVAWFQFGRRLPHAGRARLLAAVVGAGPLFGLGLLGYIGAAGVLVWNEFQPESMPAASFFVFGGLSTLIVLAGLTFVGLIYLGRGPGSSTGTTGVPAGELPAHAGTNSPPDRLAPPPAAT